MNHHMVGTCSLCGGVCDNRAQRCSRCYEGRGSDPEKLAAGWAEARELYPLIGVLCENDCGNPAVEHHHLDGDPHNNVRSNVKLVCRRCHMVLDGRLERIGTYSPPQGEASPKAKLTEGDVRAIRRRRPAEPLAALAAEYGVALSTISAIANRQNWRHVA